MTPEMAQVHHEVQVFMTTCTLVLLVAMLSFFLGAFWGMNQTVRRFNKKLEDIRKL